MEIHLYQTGMFIHGHILWLLQTWCVHLLGVTSGRMRCWSEQRSCTLLERDGSLFVKHDFDWFSGMAKVEGLTLSVLFPSLLRFSVVSMCLCSRPVALVRVRCPCVSACFRCCIFVAVSARVVLCHHVPSACFRCAVLWYGVCCADAVLCCAFSAEHRES